MNNNGFMSLIAVLVTAIVFIVAVSLITLSYMNFLATRAFINGKKAYYLSEGKLHLCMYKDKYFLYEIIPRIEHFVEYGNLRDYEEGNIIEIDEEDLREEDSINKINIDFFYENQDLKSKLIIPTRNNGITEKVIGIFNMINLFYRMELPVLSTETIPSKELLKFEIFCNELIKNLNIDKENKDFTPIEGSDFEKVSLEEDDKLQKYIAHVYKKGEEEPNEKIPIINDNLFLILKEKENLKPRLEINNSKSGKPIKGVIYVEGDIILYDNVEFYGIIVIENGSIIIKGEDKPVINGLIILSNYNGDLTLVDNVINANYHKEYIYSNGPLLPNFYEPELELLKIYR